MYYLLLCLKIAGWVANRVDPDEMLYAVASHLGLHCLYMPVCPNTYDKYCMTYVILGHIHTFIKKWTDDKFIIFVLFL